MAKVHLRPITLANINECLALRVEDSQTAFVASTAKSLAEAKVNGNLIPLGVYDEAARGYETPAVPMIGFTMYELADGLGFIMRLLIAAPYQGRGYGKATMIEVIRRLRLYPEVEMIATSYRRGNLVAAQLYKSLGFVEWQIGYATADNPEVYVCLPEQSIK